MIDLFVRGAFAFKGTSTTIRDEEGGMMYDFFKDVFLPILLSFISFGFGVLSTKLYERHKEAYKAHEDFYIPILKKITIDRLLSITKDTMFQEKDAINSLMSLSFDNLQYMSKNTQTAFMSFCSLWVLYRPDQGAGGVLTAFHEYLNLIFKDAQNNAKKIGKPIPINIADWTVNLL